MQDTVEAEVLHTNDDGSHVLYTKIDGQMEIVTIIPSQAFITVKKKEEPS